MPCCSVQLLTYTSWQRAADRHRTAQGLPLDAESIAAGIVADAVHVGEVSIEVAEERLGPICALLIRDMIKVRTLPSRCDVYDDVSTATVRELCLSFYDARCVLVRLLIKHDGLQHC